MKATVSAFCEETGLHPSHVWPVAGALLYRKYGDTSRDYESTDWEALDRFVSAMAEEIERSGRAVA